MRSKFCLAAYGNEENIRVLYDKLKFSESEIKPLRFKPPMSGPDQGIQWVWRSQYQVCKGDYPEDELDEFLRENVDLLFLLKNYRETLHDLSAIIVCEIDVGEIPRGYSVSVDTMRLLSDANASLEIDIEQLVPNRESR